LFRRTDLLVLDVELCVVLDERFAVVLEERSLAVAVAWLDRSSRPWIPFHCDTAIVTCNVALSADLDDAALIEQDSTVSAVSKHVGDLYDATPTEQDTTVPAVVTHVGDHSVGRGRDAGGGRTGTASSSASGTVPTGRAGGKLLALYGGAVRAISRGEGDLTVSLAHVFVHSSYLHHAFALLCDPVSFHFPEFYECSIWPVCVRLLLCLS
jgi:hypothetical protein